MSRFVVAALVSMLALSGLAAAAQSELEQAEEEYRRAEAELDRARGELGAASAERADVGTRLSLALTRYRETGAELERVGLALADVRYDLERQESRVRELRARNRARAADAYMRNVGGTMAPILLADSFGEVSLVNEVAVGQVALDAAAAAELDAARRHLDELRADYDDRRRRLDALAASLDDQRNGLELLFAEADARVLQAYETIDEADAAYRMALDRLEEERAKRRWTGSVEQWRPLVEQYFPPDRVGEAMAVMWCESRGDPDAKNPASTATGLFQFLDGTWAWASVLAGWGGHSRLDPEANIAVAAWLVDYSVRTGHPSGAWGHWECKP